MGYYTEFNLKVTPPKQPATPACDKCGCGGSDPIDSGDIIAALREYSENARYALDSNGDNYEACKWYEWEQDLRSFSQGYPDTLFELTGSGEDNGDLWAAYFKNGKMQKCPAQITYEPFDESKLK